MQVKIEPMSHLPFHYFWRRAASICLIPQWTSSPCQTECLDLVALSVCICALLFVRCFYAEPLLGSCRPSDKWRGVWGPCGYRVTQQPCEVVAVTSTPCCTLAERGATVQPDYRVAPLAPIFLTPRTKEWQHLWDKPVWDAMDLHRREWVAYLSREGRKHAVRGKLGQAFVICTL